MNDASVMGFAQRVGDFDAVAQHLIERQGPAINSFGEGLPLAELHYQILDTVLTPDVVEDADVRVTECGDGFRLAFETDAKSRVAGKLARQKLDGHTAIQTRVASAVDFTHSARTHALDDLVRSEPRSRYQTQRSVSNHTPALHNRRRFARNRLRSKCQADHSDADHVAICELDGLRDSRVVEPRAVLAAEVFQDGATIGDFDPGVLTRYAALHQRNGTGSIAANDVFTRNQCIRVIRREESCARGF